MHACINGLKACMNEVIQEQRNIIKSAVQDKRTKHMNCDTHDDEDDDVSQVGVVHALTDISRMFIFAYKTWFVEPVVFLEIKKEKQVEILVEIFHKEWMTRAIEQ